MAVDLTLEDLKPAPYNPRRIDDAAMAGLTCSLAEFGDISGIVWNKRTGNLVCGHQRLEALKRGHPGLVVAKGALQVDGMAFPIRVVDWPIAREKAANVSANNPYISGGFTQAELDEIVAELDGTDLADLVKPLRLDELIRLPDGADGVEVDETIADEVQFVECPECGHKFPK